MGNTQTTDIVLKENNIVAPVLDINFDEVNAALDAMLLNYKNVAVTEDTLKEARMTSVSSQVFALTSIISARTRKSLSRPPLNPLKKTARILLQRLWRLKSHFRLLLMSMTTR